MQIASQTDMNIGFVVTSLKIQSSSLIFLEANMLKICKSTKTLKTIVRCLDGVMAENGSYTADPSRSLTIPFITYSYDQFAYFSTGCFLAYTQVRPSFVLPVCFPSFIIKFPSLSHPLNLPSTPSGKNLNPAKIMVNNIVVWKIAMNIICLIIF